MSDRETEILHTVFDLFLERGYHAVRMDAVAVGARVSKATLYRRWPSRFALLDDALLQAEPQMVPVISDTRHLRSDLIDVFAGPAAELRRRTRRLLPDHSPATIERADRVARDLAERLDRYEAHATERILARAQARGEIEPGRDLDLLASVLPGSLIAYECTTGLSADRVAIERIIDALVIPAIEAGELSSLEARAS